MNQRAALGAYGERVAARQLRQSGLTVLEQNWRCAEGEIDIVAQERDTSGCLVVCEVKTRREGGFQDPLAGLGRRQAERLRWLAERWLTERWLPCHGAPPAAGLRIDLFGVLLRHRGAPVTEHVRGVA